MRDPSLAQHLSLRLAQELGSDRQGHPPGLHRGHRSRGQGTIHRVHREMGNPVPGDHPALGERLERVRAVPGLRRRDSPRHLLDKCGGITECPLPAGPRSEEHTSELQSRRDLVCRLLLEKKNKHTVATSRSASTISPSTTPPTTHATDDRVSTTSSSARVTHLNSHPELSTYTSISYN